MFNENEDIIFGQYLVRFSKYRNKVDQEMIKKAFEIQKNEDLSGKNHRRIGTILMEDFNIFVMEYELDETLREFEDFKRKYMG